MEKAIVLLVLLNLGSSSPSSKKKLDKMVGTFPVVGTLNLAPFHGKVDFHGLTKEEKRGRDHHTHNKAKNDKKQNSNRTIL